MIVIDASVVIAYFNAAERRHREVADWLDTVDEELVTTPLVLAEIDYVLQRRAGTAAIEALWADLEEGVYGVAWWPSALAETVEVARSAAAAVGLADASLVALAARVGTAKIATLDTRHFGSGSPMTSARALTLLPDSAAGMRL